MAVKLTSEAFIARSTVSHGNRYDYSRVQYRTTMQPVEIVCPVHGAFWQRPNHHMDGHGCPACKADITSSRCRDDTAAFIAKARVVHGDIYDYSHVTYAKSSTKIEIHCTVHGAFWQTPNSHLGRAAGCPKCAGKGMSTADFVGKARAVHGDTFGYQDADYRGIKAGITITCPKHGNIQQPAESHLAGNGCHLCWSESTSSRAETDLADWCASLGVRVLRNDRTALGRMEIDIYLPDQQIGVEFNGCYWHSHRVQKNNRQHEFKHEAARRAGIRLVTVWDYDWMHRQAIVKRHLAHAIGASTHPKLNARACSVVPLMPAQANALYAEHHLQGACRGAVASYGLMHSGELVAAMSFTQGGHRRGLIAAHEYELARYATAASVRGGASRLFAAFVAQHAPRVIWSFSDDQHFGGGLYPLLGFVQDGRIPADYRVVDPRTLRTWHKSLWQRKSIPLRLRDMGSAEVFDPATDPRTENQMHDVAKVLRVYDSGKTRWVWRG